MLIKVGPHLGGVVKFCRKDFFIFLQFYHFCVIFEWHCWVWSSAKVQKYRIWNVAKCHLQKSASVQPITNPPRFVARALLEPIITFGLLTYLLVFPCRIFSSLKPSTVAKRSRWRWISFFSVRSIWYFIPPPAPSASTPILRLSDVCSCFQSSPRFSLFKFSLIALFIVSSLIS